MTHQTPRRILEGAALLLLAGIAAGIRELRTPRGW
jgi:hypothetical protein